MIHIRFGIWYLKGLIQLFFRVNEKKISETQRYSVAESTRENPKIMKVLK